MEFPIAKDHVEVKPDVLARIKRQEVERARLYGVPCACPCNCRVLHRFGKVCVLCRDGDCWHNLDSYLAKIKSKEE